MSYGYIHRWIERAGMRWIVFLLCSFFFVAWADAQPATDPRKKAKEEFETAERYYQIGEYEKALTHYKESYVISGEFILLYNIGQSCRYLGRNQEALEAYELFLVKVPKSKYRANAELFVKELTVLIEKEKQAKPASEPTKVTPPASEPTTQMISPPKTLPITAPSSAALSLPVSKPAADEKRPGYMIPLALGGAAIIPSTIALVMGVRLAQEDLPAANAGEEGPALLKQARLAKGVALTADVLWLGAALSGGLVFMKRRQAAEERAP
jgi:tetratricopeptide (TPR) repeat protein